MEVLEKEVQTSSSSGAAIFPETRAYSSWRIAAAAQFSMDCVKSNMQDHRASDREYTRHPFLDTACILVSPISFVYALYALRYSPQDNCHVLG